MRFTWLYGFQRAGKMETFDQMLTFLMNLDPLAVLMHYVSI